MDTIAQKHNNIIIVDPNNWDNPSYDLSCMNRDWWEQYNIIEY